jgi:NitT/TauT family transport system substrate-binding protein
MKDLSNLTLARVAVVAFSVALTVGGIAASPGTAQAQSSPDDHTVTIKGAAPSLTIAVPLTMVAKHFDRTHGIAVDYQASGTSSTLIVDSVLAGQVEFGSPGTADALQAIRQGAKLKIIAAVVNNMLVTVVRDDVLQKLGVSPTAPIADRIRALKGLTIGTGAVGSTLYQVLRSYLKQYGVDPDNDMRVVGMGEASALISGIEQKRYDAIAYASPIPEQAIARHVGTLWFSAPRGDVPGSDNVKMAVIIARADTVEKKRADVDALRAALTDALHAVRDDHQATGQLLHETYFPHLDPAVWSAAWNAATAAYPSSLAFPHTAYEYWIGIDSKGAESYNNVDYREVVYDPAQSQ